MQLYKSKPVQQNSMACSTELCIGQMQKKNGTVAPDCNEPAYNESVDTANFPISFTWPLVRGLPLYNEPDVPPQSQYFWHRFLCTALMLSLPRSTQMQRHVPPELHNTDDTAQNCLGRLLQLLVVPPSG